MCTTCWELVEEVFAASWLLEIISNSRIVALHFFSLSSDRLEVQFSFMLENGVFCYATDRSSQMLKKQFEIFDIRTNSKKSSGLNSCFPISPLHSCPKSQPLVWHLHVYLTSISVAPWMFAMFTSPTFLPQLINRFFSLNFFLCLFFNWWMGV